MLSDAEVRGLVLATLYNLRDSNGGVVPLSDINFSPHPITPQKIDAVCQHLADLELIQWIPTPAGMETPIAGKGKIMGKGAAAFEDGRCDEINILFPPRNAMANDLISEAGRKARFERWEELGVEQVRADLATGGHRVVGGPPEVRKLAWEWLQLKEAELATGAPTYTQEAAEAVYAAIEGLVASGKRAYSLNVPIEAANALVRSGRGRISASDANTQTRAAIVGLAAAGKIEVSALPREDWLIKEPLVQELAMAAPSKKIFIVHGHDGTPKAEVARFIDKLGFEAIILHERPNKGRTLITKFQEEAGTADFAVVLMTPDDVGKAAAAVDLSARARQNVVFELGFFIGKLGPSRVAALVKGKVERPSDFDGVVYISLDDGDWQRQLGKELQAAGYAIDWNAVMGTG